MHPYNYNRLVTAVLTIRDVVQSLDDESMKTGDPNHHLDSQARQLIAHADRIDAMLADIEVEHVENA